MLFVYLSTSLITLFTYAQKFLTMQSHKFSDCQ